MITEDYVSFETAQLLKEKGFNEECFALYNPDGMLIQSGIRLNNIQVGRVEGSYSAPTLQMAMKWLRKEHNLVIKVELIDYLEHGEVWLYSVFERKTIKRLTGKGEDFTEHSYEEACDAAVKYCLENFVQCSK